MNKRVSFPEDELLSLLCKADIVQEIGSCLNRIVGLSFDVNVKQRGDVFFYVFNCHERIFQ